MKIWTLSALAVLTAATSAVAQPQRFDMPGNPAAWAAQDNRFAQWFLAAPRGSGSYGAVREVAANLTDHTIFRPASRGDKPWPVVAFANGGCRNTPIEFTAFLAEIASHGYFVIAEGTDDVTFAAASFGGADPKSGKPLQTVSRTVLTHAVDWAIAENARADSPYFGQIDARKIAYMGQSCGGMQALSASTDPRTTTTIVLNSGRFPRDRAPTLPGASFPEWFEWSELHAPIAFFSGGPSDVPTAHANFAEITRLPIFLADLPVGHTGAYPEPDQRWTRAVLGWLDWRLKESREARALFVGRRCGLCTDSDWIVTGSKNLR